MTDAHSPSPSQVRAAALMMMGASLLFATMGVCIKLAAAQYSAAEVVFYRSLIGAVMVAALVRWQGGELRTTVPLQHAGRSVTGVLSLVLWFQAIAHLPLATAMTLNYMSSVWMALFLMGGAVFLGSGRFDLRLLACVLLGFGGVALILQPTLSQDQVWWGVMGLASGLLAALAYLQVAALGRAGEPETRVVFYFCLGGVVAGAVMTSLSGWQSHTPTGVWLLLATGLSATTAQLLMTRAYAIGKPLVNASLQYLGILFSTAYGALIFDDLIPLPAYLGMVLVVGAGLSATLLRSQSVAPTLQGDART